jgi:hypothetical protein
MMKLEGNMFGKIIGKFLAWVDQVTGREYPHTYLGRKYLYFNALLDWVRERGGHFKEGKAVVKLRHNEQLVKVVDLKNNKGVLKDNLGLEVELIIDPNIWHAFYNGDIIACIVTGNFREGLKAYPLPFQSKDNYPIEWIR